jgi:hypothetical protein
MCTPTQPDRFYCYGPKSFYTASVIWGLIGPQRNYSFGGLYYACTFGFLIGESTSFLSPLVLSLTSPSRRCHPSHRSVLPRSQIPSLDLEVSRIHFCTRRSTDYCHRYVHIPAMLSLVLSIAPHGGSWVLGSLTLALIFQFWIRRS